MTVLPELLELLACPRDNAPLEQSAAGFITCSHGHTYPVVDGIPVLLIDRSENDARGFWTQRVTDSSLSFAANVETDTFDGVGIHPHVQDILASTGGFMYKGIKLESYPIPELRMPHGEGRTLLDVGCNWGRWTVAAAKAGYRVTGIDPHLVALRAARHVARAEGVTVHFVCGDARVLPFRAESFDRAFSYSVVQHFAKSEARVMLQQMAQAIKPGGQMMVQMPNRAGIRSFYHLARRGFGDGKAFDVRYYSVRELVSLFRSVVGPSTLKVDGFFGLGIQPTDLPLMPPHRRIVIHSSELLRKAARRQRWIAGFADSLYITSQKPMVVAPGPPPRP